MAIELPTVNPRASLAVVSNKVSDILSAVKVKVKAEAEAVAKPLFKPVPAAPKIEINREPIISSKELAAKIAELNEAVVSKNLAIAFIADPATGKDVVRVSNKSTGELIRQMPSVEALKAMQNIDHMMGLIFNDKS
jgi:flagellar protein FlaG